MKRPVFFFLAAVALLSACSKEDMGNTPLAPPVGKRIAVSFHADYPGFDDATRAELLIGQDSFSGTWTDGVDQIGISAFDYNNIDLSDLTDLYLADITVPGNKNLPFTRTGGIFTGYMTDYDVSDAMLGYIVYSPYRPEFVPNFMNGFIPFGPARTQVGGKFNSRYDLLVGYCNNLSTSIGVSDTTEMLDFEFQRASPIIAFDLKGVHDPIDYVTLTADQPIAADMIEIDGRFVTQSADPATLQPIHGTVYNTITLTFVDEAGNPAPVDASASDIYAFFNVPRGMGNSDLTYNLTLDAYTATGKHGIYSISNVTVGGMNPNMERSLHAGEKLQESIDADV